jgi:DNA invertase Pin-like site-specific DNA recombinase
MMNPEDHATSPAQGEQTRPKAFSYLRFSTPEQQRGDSFRRQASMAADWCQRNGVELDERSFEDLGVSGYRGLNAETGALGKFIEAVQDKSVPQGSYLLIESMDRLSRNKPRRAMRLLESIVDQGITVVTLSDSREYSAEILDDDPMALMYALMVAIRAHEESERKAQRLTAAWKHKRELAATERKPMTSMLPAWLRRNSETGEIEIIDERAAIVREVFEMALAGHGCESTAKALNQRGVPSWTVPGEYKRKKPSGKWGRSYIKLLRSNPAVMGTFIPKSKHEDRCEPIPDYYPAVISASEFQTVQAMDQAASAASGHRRHRGPAVAAHLLAGLARCPLCGSTMNRVNKGVKSNGPRLVCRNAKIGGGCRYKSVPVDAVEHGLKLNLGYTLASMPSGDAELDGKLEAVEITIEVLRDSINHVIETIAEGNLGESKALRAKLMDYEAALDEAEQEQDELMSKMTRSSYQAVQHRVRSLEALVEAGDIPAANAVLRSVLERVVVDYRSGDLLLQWVQGGQSRVHYTLPEE